MDEQGVAQRVLIFDGYHRRTGQKSKHITFRIYEDQHSRLQRMYSGTSSVLIRILLEKFFNGDLPEVETQLSKMKQEAIEAAKI